MTTLPGAAPASVDRKTIEMLVCPLTKTRLVLDKGSTELISVAARLAFPIRQGVPMLSLDEAREITPTELERLRPNLHRDEEDS